MADPQRILIVRLTAVGDVIHGLPALNALRDRFPDAHISWVVEGVAGDLLEGHRALNELIRVPRRWYKSPQQILALRKKLREKQFDTTIDLQCLTKSAAVAWMSGAARRLGADGAEGREASRWLNNELTEVNATHVIEHYLGILHPLGIELDSHGPVGFDSVRFDLECRDADKRFVRKTLESTHLTAGQFAVLNPGAGWPSKLWPPERYGEVAKHLLATHGVRSLAVWAGGDELLSASDIVAASDGACQLAPGTTLPQLGALCRSARLFVGSDTGPMHLAVAVGTPTISMHGVTRGDWCGAYGAENRTVQAIYEDGSCSQRRGADNCAMRAISVSDVNVACDQLIAKHASRFAA